WRSPSARSGSRGGARPAWRSRSPASSWSCCSARASGSRSRTRTGPCSSWPPAAFAAFNVIVKPLLPRYGALPVTAAASLIGTAALLPFAAGGTVHRVSALDAGGIVLLLYLGLVATLLGYIGWTRGLRRLEASRTVAYLYGVPVVAIVIG